MDLTTYFQKRISEHSAMVQALTGDMALLKKIGEAAKAVSQSYTEGGKLLLCGNGGSAADSQHLAAELVSRFYLERRALDAEALTVNTSCLTAIGNDYAFENIFERQVEAKGKKGDVLIGISTSGGSKDVVRALKKANEMGMVTIALGGGKGDAEIFKVATINIGIPSTVTPRIQEAHILIGHILCEYVEETLFGPG